MRHGRQTLLKGVFWQKTTIVYGNNVEKKLKQKNRNNKNQNILKMKIKICEGSKKETKYNYE